jgi:hypothetical protein
MVESRTSSSARRWALSLVLGSGCAGGEGMSGPGPWAQPATAQEDEDIDVDPHGSEGSTTDDVPDGSTMNPPPPGSSGDESGAPPMDEETTGGAWPPIPEDDETSSTSADDETPPPPGEPLWAPCNEDADCEGGTCFFVLDGDTHQPISAYCSQSCSTPESDCSPPGTGNATPTCLSTDDGASLCGLDCSYGQSCPFGMECIDVTAVASYCF